MKSDKFIVLEGIDGSGTSTQLKLLKQYFDDHKIYSFFTCEPTTSAIGKLIRTYLKGNDTTTEEALAYLFSADRACHLNGSGGIVEALDSGKWVICDRYIFSTLAYQSCNCNYDFLLSLNSNFLLPSKVIFIDTSAESANERVEARGEAREIYENLQTQKVVRQNYLRAFNDFSDKIELLTINGENSIEEIFATILNFLGLKDE